MKNLKNKLERLLKENRSIICTHFHADDIKSGVGYYYLADEDFYTKSRTVYASWEVSPQDVIGKENVKKLIRRLEMYRAKKLQLIPLAKWAKSQGILPDTARQKANRGGYKTAIKLGRDWFISPNEENIDLRKKPKQGQ